MISPIRIVALLTVLSLVGSCATDPNSDPALPVEGPASVDGFVLDYTAYLPEAIQPSGVAVSPDGGHVAIVTDFEKVVVYETATQEIVSRHDVARGALPEQGSTEAVTLKNDGTLAVLYPDDKVIATLSTDGSTEEIVVGVPGSIDGAMTIYRDDFVLYEREDSGAHVVTVTPEGVSSRTPTRLTDAPLEGLTTGVDNSLWAITSAGEILSTPSPLSSSWDLHGTLSEVDEPSGIAFWHNRDEGESQLVITDDGDAYNASPSPLRLYVADLLPAP